MVSSWHHVPSDIDQYSQVTPGTDDPYVHRPGHRVRRLVGVHVQPSNGLVCQAVILFDAASQLRAHFSRRLGITGVWERGRDLSVGYRPADRGGDGISPHDRLDDYSISARSPCGRARTASIIYFSADALEEYRA